MPPVADGKATSLDLATIVIFLAAFLVAYKFLGPRFL